MSPSRTELITFPEPTLSNSNPAEQCLCLLFFMLGSLLTGKVPAEAPQEENGPPPPDSPPRAVPCRQLSGIGDTSGILPGRAGSLRTSAGQWLVAMKAQD